MRTKNVFLMTFVFGLVWTGVLFAFSTGPNPGVNGVFGPTCRQAGCHFSFPLNSPGGSIAVAGLPSQWAPGQTYPITVTVSRSGSLRYGFQFSVVSDSTNQQAGTLSAATPVDTRVSIISGGGIQYAQHNSFPNFSGIFNFSWTAPASAAFGAVRMNVAGNAADNSGSPIGDFIYATATVISPAAGDTTPPLISAVVPSGVTASAALITWTTDEASDTEVEFGPTAAYGQSTTLDASLTMAHTATLAGLSSATTYHFRVKSRDAAGNLATSGDFSFSTPFSISNLSGVSRTTDGSGPLVVGYGRVQPIPASTAPSGVAIFGFRPAGILVTEAGVPDSPAITSGRIHAEVSADLKVNTGIAIANPNNQPAALTFTYRDTSGAVVKTGNTTIASNEQIAKFLDEDPFLSPSGGFLGTFSFSSNVPISVIALRGFFNERTPSEFLITTLPVVTAGSAGTQVIPHFAVGDGWTTQIVLVNATGTAQTGTLQFLSPAGAPVNVSVGGQPANSFPYSVAADSSQMFLATPAAGGLTVGSVRVVPSGSAAPTPLVIFTYKPAGVTVSEAGVPVTMGTVFRMYVETSLPFIDSGIAIANATGAAGTVTMEVTKFDDPTVTHTATGINLPASGQIVSFLSGFNFNPPLPQSLKGVLRITTTVSDISVVALRGRYNERIPPDFLITTTPPTLETAAPSLTERFFPHFVNGGGYTSQFILFSGTAGQVSEGNLPFFTKQGTTLNLDIQ